MSNLQIFLMCSGIGLWTGVFVFAVLCTWEWFTDKFRPGL